MASIIKKIVNDFDDKWMRILFHQSDFLMNCLNFSLIQEINLKYTPFDCKYFLIMLPDCFEYSCKATLSDKVVLAKFICVGFIALLRTTS
jgi:hypothetical protein